MSQAELAEEIDVSLTTVWRWEKADHLGHHRCPRRVYRRALRRFFNHPEQRTALRDAGVPHPFADPEAASPTERDPKSAQP